MEDEQKEILDGVIVDISKFSFEKRKELLSFSEKLQKNFLETNHSHSNGLTKIPLRQKKFYILPRVMMVL